MKRHVFFGGNTPEGFVNRFSDILFEDEAKKIIYIKGASGSGKSTLIKKTAEVFEKEGLDIDYIHCSNSSGDLDGICVRERGIAIVDGTFPHICDPAVPAAVDEIFNTLDYMDKAYAESKREELISLHNRKKPYFAKAYNYLNSAYHVRLNSKYIYDKSLNRAKLAKAIHDELDLFKNIPLEDKIGRNRRMFAGAITPQGLVNYIDSFKQTQKVVCLSGEEGMGTDEMLEGIKNAALLRGFDTEGMYCSLNPSKLEHLLIPKLNIFYTTKNACHSATLTPERTIDFSEFLEMHQLLIREDEIEYNDEVFTELLKMSMEMMERQKIVHDEIEKIYGGGMDFEGLNKAAQSITDRLINFVV